MLLRELCERCDFIWVSAPIAGKQGEEAIFSAGSEFYLLTVGRGLMVEIKNGTSTVR